jgi:hypothetical protein
MTASTGWRAVNSRPDLGIFIFLSIHVLKEDYKRFSRIQVVNSGDKW